MNVKVGPPVEGDDFFGREKEIEYVWKGICGGNNYIFPSPRRVGKTSFALKLIEKAKEEKWHTVAINLEMVTSEFAFVESLTTHLTKLSWWEAAKEKTGSFLANLNTLKPKVSYAGATLELEWIAGKKDIYKQLADLIDHKENTLIFLDELTVLLNSILKEGEDGKKNVTAFLHWLRDLRITAGSKIKWIYCSSVGIENFTHSHGISDTINDTIDYKLKSYKKEESEAMLRKLGQDNQLILGDKLNAQIVDKLEYCLPFFLQLYFERINYLVAIEDRQLDETIVEAAYKDLIEGKHFNTWIERINEQYGDKNANTFRILKHLCQAKTGSPRANLLDILISQGLVPENAEEILSTLLYMLKNDGYLIDEDGLYRFRSPLLRDFWFNRFVK